MDSILLVHIGGCHHDLAWVPISMNASELARLHTERAIEVLAGELDGEDPRDRIKAAEVLLDRGHGKAAQAIIAVPASKQQQALLAALSDDELIGMLNQVRLPRLAPIDAEFAEVVDPLLR